MPVEDQVVWTVLPQGFTPTGDLKLSALVSPRLSVGGPGSIGTVGQLPSWLDWPSRLDGIGFSLVVDGAPATALTRIPAASSRVWRAMIRDATPVKSWAFTDLSSKKILSVPIALLAQAIEDFYASMGARSADGLPAQDELHRVLVGKFGANPEIKYGPDLRRTVYNRLSPAARPRMDTAWAMALLAAYHQPMSRKPFPERPPRPGRTWSDFVRPALPSPAALAASVDFHQIAASVIEHPELARRMGLLLDFEVPSAAIPSGAKSIRLKVDGGGAALPDICPAARIVRSGGDAFEMQPNSPGSPLSGRFLKLSDPAFALVQMDVDGGALKLKNVAQTSSRIIPQAYDDARFDPEPPRMGLPSLRTGGLTLAQSGRDLELLARANANAALAGADPNTLPDVGAEDAVRGYRVDVKDETRGGPWRSLMQREVTLEFLKDPGAGDRKPLREEGFMRLSGGNSADPDDPDLLKISEALFVWRGWSLAAPEPFKAVATEDAPRHDPAGNPLPPTADPQGDAPPAGLPLKTTVGFKPGSLPPLRFGHSYRVRARVVDLSGLSAPLEAQEPVEARTDAVVYRRYEPVEAPVVVLPMQGSAPIPLGPGESMRLAAVRTFNADPAANVPAEPVRIERLVAPPRVAARFAEPHGVLDAPDGRPNPDLFGTLRDLDSDFTQAIPPLPGRFFAGPDLSANGPHPAASPKATAPYLPYLPDPFAAGVAIRISGVAGVDPAQVFKIPLYGEDLSVVRGWPNAKPFRIVGSETVTAPQFVGGDDPAFMVPLKKGERVVLRLSSLIPKSRLDHMALQGLILAVANDRAKVQTAFEDGQHYMLTPWHDLVLVHAVQKPLVTPRLERLTLKRAAVGVLDATVSFVTPVSAASTGKIELQAGWFEPSDDPEADASASGPIRVRHLQHVLARSVSRSDGGELQIGADAGDPAVHAFHDTRYRRVLYRLDATSRYGEFMPSELRGDTTVTSVEVERRAPNTAPPPAPRVLYVIPTFGWTRSPVPGGGASSLRSGNGLRVYLDRPWFVSGFGEMLAVVLPGPDAGAEDLQTSLKPLVSQWGRDPLWAGGQISTLAPPRTAPVFPLARWAAPIGFEVTGEGAPLAPETVETFLNEHAFALGNDDQAFGPFKVDNFRAPTQEPRTLEIAPHPVAWDSDRQLWYCDIVIRPPAGTYFPFVRLALARYQPVSVDGAHLSSVVTTDFQQLTADRLAVVARNGAGASLSVYGYGPAPMQPGPKGCLFQVRIQGLPAGGDPDLDWRDLAAPQPPGSAPATQASPPASPLGTGPGLLWSWAGDLPSAPAGGRRRLLITEAEQMRSGDGASSQMAERIVYAETIEL